MATLAKRATPQQHRILRIVEGAVKNAADAHPNLTISPRHRRSIAKRAAGTLTAQWPDVLAARPLAPSDSGAPDTYRSGRRQSSELSAAADRGAQSRRMRTPLCRLRRLIGAQLHDIKQAGQVERAAAFVDVLRMIHQLEAEARA